MLVLSRTRDEVLVIGMPFDIEIKVFEIKGKQVRIGIRAPNYGIARGEILDGDQLPSNGGGNEGGGYCVLSRKKDEVIRIGARIVLMVVDIQGDKARLGIQAPRDVPVHRWEVYEAILKKDAAPPVTAS